MRFLVLFAICFAACSNISPTSAMRLSMISPLTADPADVAVALRLPDGIDVTPGSARLTFTIVRRDRAEVAGGSFLLVTDDDTYFIAPGDHAAVRSVQALGRKWKSEAPEQVEGSLSVTLAPCAIGDGPEPDATVDVAIRLDQDGPFIPLIRGGSLTAIAAPEVIASLMACS